MLIDYKEHQETSGRTFLQTQDRPRHPQLQLQLQLEVLIQCDSLLYHFICMHLSLKKIKKVEKVEIENCSIDEEKS